MNKVVVVIPHFNDPEKLKRSIASISQEEACDVLIVDDGSVKTFSEDALLKSFSAQGHLFFLYLKKNSGIETALNKGLEWAKEKNYIYIARLDCGDVHQNNRINKQVNFLQLNQHIQLVGSWAEAMDLQGQSLYQLRLPVEHEEIRRKMFLNNMFIHPTVMFRTKALEVIKEYPYDYPAAEDYAFFFKFVQIFQTANIPEVLIRFEINPHGGISSTRRKAQVKSRIKIVMENFEWNYYPIVGLARNSLLLLIPRKYVESVKKKILWKAK